MNFNCKAAIFDLDGTLLDSTHLWRDIDDVFLAKRNLSREKFDYNQVAHMSLIEAALYTKELYSLSESVDSIVLEWKFMAYDAYSKNVKLKENSYEYLCLLKKSGIKLAVATGLPHNVINVSLKKLGILHFFDAICSVDDVGVGKSSPDVYLYACEKIEVKPCECVVYEDVIDCIKCAKSIGMKVCAVWDKASAHVLDIHKYSDCYIKNWNELL